MQGKQDFFIWPNVLVGATVVLAASLSYFIITVSHSDRLHNAINVVSFSRDSIVTVDGKVVKVPLIDSLPVNLVLFQSALRSGIELDEHGMVFGLVTYDDSCGMEWVTRHLRRVNITALAAALNPASLDKSKVRRETIEQIESMARIDLSEPSRSHRRGRFTAWDLDAIRRAAEILDPPIE